MVVTAPAADEQTPPVRRAVGATGAAAGFGRGPRYCATPRGCLLVKRSEGRDGDRASQRVAGDETGAQGRRKRGHAARLDTIARSVAKLRVDRLDERFQDRDARRQDRGLGNGRVVEILRRPGEADLRKLVPDCAVGLIENVAGARRLLVDRLAHANDLRALTRENECEISHV